MTPLLDFYTNVGTDLVGRTFDDVMTMTDAALDASHDWVQWLFPLRGPCNFNPQAPAPTAPEIAFLKANAEAQTNLSRAFVRFLQYLSLCEGPDGKIAPGPNFDERYNAVWSHFNHTHLRVTRFLSSVWSLGQEGWSRETCRCLCGLGHAGRIVMSYPTQMSWIYPQTPWRDPYWGNTPGKTLAACVARHGYCSPEDSEQEAQSRIEGIISESRNYMRTLTRWRNQQGKPGKSMPPYMSGPPQEQPETTEQFLRRYGFAPDTEEEVQHIVDVILLDNRRIRYDLTGPDGM